MNVGGEVGGNYAVGAKLALFGSPAPGLSIGGSAYFAPLSVLPAPPSCITACNPIYDTMTRAMVEVRGGNPYREYASGLAWGGFAAGVMYLSGVDVVPSPVGQASAGGDLRLARNFWLELVLRMSVADVIGPGSSSSGIYFTVGVDVGFRLDLAH